MQEQIQPSENLICDEHYPLEDKDPTHGSPDCDYFSGRVAEVVGVLQVPQLSQNHHNCESKKHDLEHERIGNHYDVLLV